MPSTVRPSLARTCPARPRPRLPMDSVAPPARNASPPADRSADTPGRRRGRTRRRTSAGPPQLSRKAREPPRTRDGCAGASPVRAEPPAGRALPRAQRVLLFRIGSALLRVEHLGLQLMHARGIRSHDCEPLELFRREPACDQPEVVEQVRVGRVLARRRCTGRPCPSRSVRDTRE